MVSKSCVVFVVAVVLIEFRECFCADLPKTFKKCEVKKPTFNQCLAEAVELALRELRTGSREMSMPTMEPVEIPKLLIGAGKGAVNLQQNLKNVLIHGISSVKVKDFSLDFKNNLMKMETFTTNVTLEADYDLNGRILSLPLQGVGHLSFVFTDATIYHTIKAEEFAKKGNKHFRITNYDLTIKPKKLEIYMDNLFNGDNQLRDAMLKVLNDNWEVLFDDIHGAYEEALGLVFKQYANGIFVKVPLKNIFIF